jgi:hypothetical protein
MDKLVIDEQLLARLAAVVAAKHLELPPLLTRRYATLISDLGKCAAAIASARARQLDPTSN